MANYTRASVLSVLDITTNLKDVYFLYDLGVELPNLRRPRGREGTWDVDRYRSLPPALRAATIFFTFRAEVNNGGVDQFVWNQFSILAETVDAFVHIGALGAAGLIAELAEEIVRESPESLEEDSVARFLAFRRAVGERGWAPADDPLADVRDALLRHGNAHPEEFVLEIVERSDWGNDRQRFRSSILRQVDGGLLVDVEIGLGLLASTNWYALSRPAAVYQDLEAARAAVAEAQARRRFPPTECTFVVANSSSSNDRWTIWPDDTLPLDALPLGPIRAEFSRGDERVSAIGTFDPDPMDNRGYGKVVVDVAPPDTTHWPPREPRWQGRCVAG